MLALSIVFFPATGYSIGAFRAELLNPGDLRLLPAYCKPKAHAYGDQRDHPEVARWLRVMDHSDWRHLHHYCLALLHTTYANNEYDQHKRRGHLAKTVQEIAYMQRGVSSAFILNPEMAAKKGKAHIKLGEHGLAVGEFLKALEYKKDYIPAYMGLVDLNIELKNYAEADKYLRLGLEYDPDSKGLKRRSIKLGKLMRK